MKDIREGDLLQIQEFVKEQFGNESKYIIKKLGGMTNRTYKVSILDVGVFVFRIPGEGTNNIINRGEEKISMLLAQKLDIDAKMIFWRDDGFKISVYIENARTMDAQLLKVPSRIREAARVLNRLHNCGVNTKIEFDVLHIAQKYEDYVKAYRIPFFEEYELYKSKVIQIRQLIRNHWGNTEVPCHNDPLCENWIEGEGRLYLIDWEYAGMNDAMWDLAALSIESGYEYIEEQILIEAYYDYKVSPEQIKKYEANKIFVDYLWALWGKTRECIEGTRMKEYSVIRFERMKRNIVNYENQYGKLK